MVRFPSYLHGVPPSCIRWESSPWTACSTSCGGGIQSRSVSCVEEDMQGTITPTEEWKCLYASKTSILQPCNTFDCPSWIAQEWSPVSFSLENTEWKKEFPPKIYSTIAYGLLMKEPNFLLFFYHFTQFRNKCPTLLPHWRIFTSPPCEQGHTKPQGNQIVTPSKRCGAVCLAHSSSPFKMFVLAEDVQTFLLSRANGVH